MSRRRRNLIWLFLLVGVVTGVSLLWQRLHTPLPPLEVGLWYWHQPFRVPPEEAAQLKAMGVRQLFVRTGTFQQQERGVRLNLPQIWSGRADGMQVHLVFNFDYSIVRHFANLANATLVADIKKALLSERERALRAGVNVAGFQLDFDCPTRRLPKYANLLQTLRAALAADIAKTGLPGPSALLSITALPTWFSSGDVQQVLEAVDFSVPQFYEAEIPKSLDRFATVSRLSLMERTLRSAGRRGQPFYAGLPAYGHALAYDERGRLVGLYRDKDLQEAVHHPAFRLARAFPVDREGQPARTPQTYIGEEIVDLVAIEPARDGRGRGWHLLYDLPSPTLVAQHLARVRAERPRNCRGVILFRYPEPGSTMTLPLSALAATLKGAAPQPTLCVQTKATVAPWELIETGRKADRAPVDLTLVVTNTGAASTFFAPDAVTVTLTFDRPGLEEIALRHFDSVETFAGEPLRPPPNAPAAASATSVPPPRLRTAPPAPLRSSPRRANVAVFRRWHLAAGETARIGPIHLPADGATKVWGTWSVRSPDGFDTRHGDIPPTALP